MTDMTRMVGKTCQKGPPSGRRSAVGQASEACLHEYSERAVGSSFSQEW